MTLLGIDLGTSSVKVVLMAPDGRLLAQAVAGYRLRSERSGWAETDPADWWRAVVAAVREVVASAGARPAAIGLSGQMHGVVLADAGGRPTRPALLWADARAVAQVEAYRALAPGLRARLANPLVPGMAGPLLLWVAAHEPEAYRRARWALQPKDWLRLRLVGEARAEPSDASATLLYDVAADAWSDDVIAALGLEPALLAPLAPSGQAAGSLAAAAAGELGLPAGLPVAASAADTAAAALGSGLGTPGQLQLTIGTGGQIVAPRDEPAAAEGPVTHLYRAATPRGWYAMAATLSAGLALGWAREVLAASWEELYAAAAREPRAGDPLFLPHLAGERTPYLDPALRGRLVGLELGHERPAILRSVLEGVAFGLGEAFDCLPEAAGAGPVRLAGGGSTHPAWRQLLADVLGRPLHAVDVPGASARGAALLGGIASGRLRFDDAFGPLAPATTPVAGPRAALGPLYAQRRARFRAEVAT